MISHSAVKRERYPSPPNERHIFKMVSIFYLRLIIMLPAFTKVSTEKFVFKQHTCFLVNLDLFLRGGGHGSFLEDRFYNTNILGGQ